MSLARAGADDAEVVVVRPYVVGDAPGTREVFTAAVRRTAAERYSPEQLRAWAPDDVEPEAWAARRSDATTVVACLGDVAGELVGFAGLVDDGGGTGVLDMLYVHPDAGRHGVGRVLVEHVVGTCRDRRLQRLDVRASHLLRPLLERLGFVVDDEARDAERGGVVLTRWAMHRDLAPRPVEPAALPGALAPPA